MEGGRNFGSTVWIVQKDNMGGEAVGMRTLRVFLLLLLESPCSLAGPFVHHVFYSI